MVSEIALLSTLTMPIRISGMRKLANRRSAAGRATLTTVFRLPRPFSTLVEEELSTTSGHSTVISSVSIRAKASLVVASAVSKYYSESRGLDFHTKSTGRLARTRDYIDSCPTVLQELVSLPSSTVCSTWSS